MENILNQIKNCLYIIIALLVILIITIIAVNGDSKSTNTTTNDEESDIYYTEEDIKDFKKITPTEYMSEINSDEPVVVYFGRPTCYYCGEFLPTLQKAQEQFGYVTRYIDIYDDEVQSDAQYNNMVNGINSLTESYNNEHGSDYESLYGYTPLIAVMQNGTIKGIWIGNGEYDNFVEFLKSKGIE